MLLEIVATTTSASAMLACIMCAFAAMLVCIMHALLQRAEPGPLFAEHGPLFSRCALIGFFNCSSLQRRGNTAVL